MESKNVNMPKPVQIVVPDKQLHNFKLNKEVLEEILLQDSVQDLPVVIVSIAGSFRKGKSFLLNFLLRYLMSLSAGREDWFPLGEEPLDGFLWRGGEAPHTTGIWIWSKVYKVKTYSDEEVAVILMDTQGIFDSTSTNQECASIFALSTMISSIQVYNLSQHIYENDLQHLQFFTEYGLLALEDESAVGMGKPFQKLQFLVRDWGFWYVDPYGEKGGSQLLKRTLEVSGQQHKEHKSVRSHIRSAFDNVSCFLLPHPGKDIAASQNVERRVSAMDPDFKKHLKEFVHLILSPENLIVKKIGGNRVLVKELVHYFQFYTKNTNELPNVISWYETTAQAMNLLALKDALTVYRKMMDAYIDVCQNRFIEIDKLTTEHKRAKLEAIRIFKETKKLGGEYAKKYLEDLKKDIKRNFSAYKLRNDRNQNKGTMDSLKKAAIFGGIGATVASTTVAVIAVAPASLIYVGVVSSMYYVKQFFQKDVDNSLLIFSILTIILAVCLAGAIGIPICFGIGAWKIYKRWNNPKNKNN